MGFSNITVDSIVGDEQSGVQAMFPRFAFDVESIPSLAQIREYARKAISSVSRQVTFKGYSPQTLTAADDLEFVRGWIELTVAAEVHSVIDQFKDSPVANARQKQLEELNRQFAASEDPFPTVARSARSNTVDIYPQRLIRVRGSEL